MLLQARISADKLQRKIGSVQQILIDEVDNEGAIGRTTADAPEIDGRVYLEAAFGVKPGELITARIVAADEHDLHAEVLSKG